jgi:general nucleoside transport system ATP-binding protein
VGERQRVEILKALYRDARILILDEPTAVLTPQETGALFATLRKAVAQGLSIIFISHKLREVMEISDRCMVLRHGRKVGEVRTAETSREALAALMVGDTPPEQRVRGRSRTGAPPARGVSTPDRGAAPGLKDVSLTLHAGQITGLAGVSGNGQAALADLIGGLARPASGLIEIAAQRPPPGRRARRSRPAWAASPRTGTAPARSGTSP